MQACLAAANPAALFPVAAHELAAHRGYLVRFAKARLSDPVLAEDAVHDVFEAVISGRATFAGRAALRSWLTAVLKNKIVDIVRRRPMMDTLGDDLGDDESTSHVQACPHAGPEERAEQRQRLRQALDRIDKLPDGLRDAVRLRLIEDRPTAEVCETLAISEDNLFVRLHRARKALLN
jgi:RNA polymerase sigma-70 factor (ECF subfamily)